MVRMIRRVSVAGLLMAGALGAQSETSGNAALTPAERAKADHGVPPYTAADVQFMQGMIGHHAQAVVMAGWAPSHGARRDVRVMCERIDVSQRDEIASMQTWLRDRHEMVPDPTAHGGMAGMAGMGTATLMPGMLTPEQMAQLDAARGPEFDRLFLTFMIQHHKGALTMVDGLFSARGAGQDDTIFKFASDVAADQTAEIDRMESMLGQ